MPAIYTLTAVSAAITLLTFQKHQAIEKEAMFCKICRLRLGFRRTLTGSHLDGNSATCNHVCVCNEVCFLNYNCSACTGNSSPSAFHHLTIALSQARTRLKHHSALHLLAFASNFSGSHQLAHYREIHRRVASCQGICRLKGITGQQPNEVVQSELILPDSSSPLSLYQLSRHDLRNVALQTATGSASKTDRSSLLAIAQTKVKAVNHLSWDVQYAEVRCLSR